MTKIAPEAAGDWAFPLRGRAGHEPSQQAVSAVPAGIPNAEAAYRVEDYPRVYRRMWAFYGAQAKAKLALADLLEIVEAAIRAGDWTVDGACDPDGAIRRARRVLEGDAP